MHPHKEAERTAYYRRQAAACATAALTTAIAEIKQAYLDLEQAWLCLAPKDALADQVSRAAGNDTKLERLEAPKQGVMCRCDAKV